MQITREAVEAAASRLSGQLVATPILGEPILPGRGRVPNLRLKVEALQPSGSAWFRGAMHALARRFGDTKTLAVSGKPRWVLGWAWAAALQIEVHWEKERAEDPLWRERLEAVPGLQLLLHDDRETTERVMAERGAAGIRLAPGDEDPEVFAGLATLGFELADELGSGIERVVVGPGRLVEPVRKGLELGGREVEVEAVSRARLPIEERKRLQHLLHVHLRLEVGPGAAAAFGRGLELADSGQEVCVVLGG